MRQSNKGYCDVKHQFWSLDDLPHKHITCVIMQKDIREQRSKKWM